MRKSKDRPLPLITWWLCALLMLPGQSAVQSAVQSASGSFQSSADGQQLAQGAVGGADFDGQAAFEYLKQIVDIGPRVSTSAGMLKQIEFLTSHFEELGGQVFRQPFQVKHPETGNLVELNNLIVRWHPERKQRLLICCHYDTRPFPDRDPVNPRGLFLGANDGASGVALLCELGRFIPAMEGKYGIDFVFFDGEEFVFVYRRDPMFLGSTFFAQEYLKRRGNWRYQYGILVDMVADADLQIYMEGNSMNYCPRLTRSIWAVAKSLAVEEFRPETRHTIRDDHIPLNEIARIETCNIIDFDYPNPEKGNIYWHTEKDVAENCSADSLGKVGRVVLEWLRQMSRLNRLK